MYIRITIPDSGHVGISDSVNLNDSSSDWHTLSMSNVRKLISSFSEILRSLGYIISDPVCVVNFSAISKLKLSNEWYKILYYIYTLDTYQHSNDQFS